MTVRSERQEALARYREAKVKILIPIAVKEFAVHLVTFKEVREPKPDGQEGRVVKVIGALKGDIRMEGMMQPVHIETDVEVNANFGLLSEINDGLAPALRQFLDIAIQRYMESKKEKLPPAVKTVVPEFRPLANPDGTAPKTPKTIAASERMKAINAGNAERKAAAREYEAAGATAVRPTMSSDGTVIRTKNPAKVEWMNTLNARRAARQAADREYEAAGESVPSEEVDPTDGEFVKSVNSMIENHPIHPENAEVAHG